MKGNKDLFGRVQTVVSEMFDLCVDTLRLVYTLLTGTRRKKRLFLYVQAKVMAAFVACLDKEVNSLKDSTPPDLLRSALYDEVAFKCVLLQWHKQLLNTKLPFLLFLRVCFCKYVLQVMRLIILTILFAIVQICLTHAAAFKNHKMEQGNHTFGHAWNSWQYMP